MDLYFLRHGLAGRHGDLKYKDDSLRPLTEEGKEKLRQTARGMQALGLSFDAIFSSPFVRARQTAEIVAKAYGIKKTGIRLTNNLLPPASAKNLLNDVGSSPASVLLVGHEPHLTEMISELLKSSRPLAVDFKKGGLCCVHIEDKGPCLQWLLTPKHLACMGKSA